MRERDPLRNGNVYAWIPIGCGLDLQYIIPFCKCNFFTGSRLENWILSSWIKSLMVARNTPGGGILYPLWNSTYGIGYQIFRGAGIKFFQFGILALCCIFRSHDVLKGCWRAGKNLLPRQNVQQKIVPGFWIRQDLKVNLWGNFLALFCGNTSWLYSIYSVYKSNHGKILFGPIRCKVSSSFVNSWAALWSPWPNPDLLCLINCGEGLSLQTELSLGKIGFCFWRDC